VKKDPIGGALSMTPTASIPSEHARILNAFRRAAVAALLSPALVAGCGGGAAVAVAASDGSLATDSTAARDARADAVDETLVDLVDAATNDGDAGSASDVAPDEFVYSPACAPVRADAGPNDASTPVFRCVREYVLPCGIPPAFTSTGACGFAQSDCASLCVTAFTKDCWLTGTSCADGGIAAEAGPVTLSCDVCPGSGRRPPCLESARTRGATRDLGAYFATLAHLEAASVPAFRRIARELRVHGAPRALVRAATSAARDEVRHARATTRLARRFGVEPPAPRVGRAPGRSLEQLARDNEIEGCVRETFGALLAQVQSERASDRDVAAAFAHIAADETRHAALSWAISRWARGKLPPAALDRVRLARRAAVSDLRRDAVAVSARIGAIAGHPSRVAQQRLARALDESLWAE
jgi:hypothetical protein